MAYMKKATVYILDCGPPMGITLPNHESTVFQESRNMIIAKLEDRLLAGRKTDQTSVILAGTKGTDNIVASEKPGQYSHVTTLSGIIQPDLELLKKVVNAPMLESDDSTADIFDAIIVAIEVIRRHCRKLKYDRHIQVVTTLDNDVDWQDMEAVQNILREDNISMTVICVGLDDVIEGKGQPSEIQKENVAQWKKFIKGVRDGELVDYQLLFTEMQKFRRKEVRPSPTFRGFLHLGDPAAHPDTSLSISINMYAHIYEAKLPTAKKWSPVSTARGDSSAGGQSSHRVDAEKQYKTKPPSDVADGGSDELPEDIATDQSRPVDQNDIRKAYKFGKSHVTVQPEVEDYMRLATEPDMSIIGFYAESAIPRDYLISNIYVITAGSYDTDYAGRAISTLAKSMKKMSAVALVRHVSRANVPPKIAILAPYFAEDVDVLRYVQVPFAEDVRQFIFNSLDKVTTSSGKIIDKDHPHLPTREMVDVLNNVIDSMDLDSLGTDEEGHHYLQPDNTYNPHLWLFNKAISTRALNPAAPIPELDPRLVKQFEPPSQLIERSKQSSIELKRLLNVKKVDRPEKKGRYRADQISESDANLRNVEDIVRSGQTGVKQEEQDFGSLLQRSRGVREISNADPVGDFKDMIKNMDEDLVTPAVTQMTAKILDLVTKSFGDRNYAKAMDCLKVLRPAAAKENESDAFNRFMYQLKNVCDPGNPKSQRRDFWDLMKTGRMTLISNAEAVDSDIRPEEAEAYLTDVDTIMETSPTGPTQEGSETQDSDLFDLME